MIYVGSDGHINVFTGKITIKRTHDIDLGECKHKK